MMKSNSENTTFVGREEDLKQLMTFTRDALAGNASVALIRGEAGTGKTTLLREVCRQIREEHPALILAIGQCATGEISYHPFRLLIEDLIEAKTEGMLTGNVAHERLRTIRQAIMGVIQDIGPDVTEIFFPATAASDLVKDIRTLPDGLLKPDQKNRIGLTLAHDLEQIQVFGWYAQIIKALADHFPVVLCLDDLHLADISSLHLFLHLGRELRPYQVALLGAFCPEKATPGSLLRQITQVVKRIHITDRHRHVRQTSYAALQQIKEALQPYSLLECALSIPKEQPGHASPMATAGTEVSVRFETVLSALNAAEHANWWYGASEALRYGQIGLDVLEHSADSFSKKTYAETKWRLLLELANAAEILGDRQLEQDYLRAGIAYLEDHLPVLDVADDLLHADIYAQLGKLYYRQGINFREAATALERAFYIYEQQHDQEKMFQVLYQLADAYLRLTDSDKTPTPLDKSINALEKCLTLAEQFQDIALKIRCLSLLTVKYVERDFSHAETCAQEAWQLATTHAQINPYVRIKALNAMATVCRENGQFQTGIRYLETALERARRLGDVLLEAAILNDLGFDYGRYVALQREAQDAFEQSLAIRKRVGLNQSAPLCNVGWLLMRQGKWPEAEHYFRQAVIEPSDALQAVYRGNIGRLYELQENYAQAELELLYRLEVLEKYHAPPNLFGYTEMMLSYALSGDQARSRRYMEAAQALFTCETRPRRKWWCLYEMADGHRLLGEFEAARTACQQAIEWFLDNAEDAEGVVYLAEAHLVMGKILVDRGAYQESLASLNKAKSAFQYCQHYALGETLFFLGKAYQGIGDTMQAKEYLTQAVIKFQQLGLHHKKREAQAMIEARDETGISSYTGNY